MTIRDAVLANLKKITDPVSGQDIVSAGIVRALNVDGDTVRFVLEIDPKLAERMEPVRAAAEQAAQMTDGVSKVSAMMTAHSEKAPPDLKPKPKPSQTGPQAVPALTGSSPSHPERGRRKVYGLCQPGLRPGGRGAACRVVGR